jgi:restriction system protein
MPIPKHNEIYREILTVLSDGEPHSLTDLRDSIAKLKNVSAKERTLMLASGVRSVFDDRVGWARTYLKAAGLIDYPKRGITQITSSGRQVLKDNPTVIDNYFLSRYDSFKDFLSRTKDTSEPAPGEEQGDQSTPLERMESAFSEINSSLGFELLSEIMSRPPEFFERVVVGLLIKMGYGGSLGEEAGKVTKYAGDEGIDGIIREDKLGFSNIFIQAKRWNPDKTVSRPDIQAFVGAIANKAGKGLFITTATFSDGARQSARENHIVLIDGMRLTSLMIQYDVGVSTVQTYDIKKVDSDFFSE